MVIVLVVTCDAIHSSIQDYPNVTLNDCGIGKESHLMTDKCFKWHSSDDMMGAIHQGRELTAGEMPYIVALIMIKEIR